MTDQQGIIRRVFHSHRDGHIHKSDAENCRTCQKLKQIEQELRVEIDMALPKCPYSNPEHECDNNALRTILLGKKEQQA